MAYFTFLMKKGHFYSTQSTKRHAGLSLGRTGLHSPYDDKQVSNLAVQATEHLWGLGGKRTNLR